MTVVAAAVIGGALAGFGAIEGSWWGAALLFAAVMAIGEGIGRAVAGTFRRHRLGPPPPPRGRGG